jgi:hypothetical protein
MERSGMIRGAGLAPLDRATVHPEDPACTNASS